MNRTKFIKKNTARELWYKLIPDPNKWTMATTELIDLLNNNPETASHEIKMGQIYDRLTITMKNGDSFSKEYFAY